MNSHTVVADVHAADIDSYRKTRCKGPAVHRQPKRKQEREVLLPPVTSKVKGGFISHGTGISSSRESVGDSRAGGRSGRLRYLYE